MNKEKQKISKSNSDNPKQGCGLLQELISNLLISSEMPMRLGLVAAITRLPSQKSNLLTQSIIFILSYLKFSTVVTIVQILKD